VAVLLANSGGVLDVSADDQYAVLEARYFARSNLRRPMATTDPKLLEPDSISITDAVLDGVKRRVLHVQ
jgi:hypothetical protein